MTDTNPRSAFADFSQNPRKLTDDWVYLKTRPDGVEIWVDRGGKFFSVKRDATAYDGLRLLYSGINLSEIERKLSQHLTLIPAICWSHYGPPHVVKVLDFDRRADKGRDERGRLVDEHRLFVYSDDLLTRMTAAYHEEEAMRERHQAMLKEAPNLTIQRLAEFRAQLEAAQPAPPAQETTDDRSP
jgi:hypothetical protein